MSNKSNATNRENKIGQRPDRMRKNKARTRYFEAMDFKNNLPQRPDIYLPEKVKSSKCSKCKKHKRLLGKNLCGNCQIKAK